VVGPAVAGILVAGIGEGWCFFANAVSYIAVLIGLFMMNTPPFVPPKMTTSALQNIAEGLRFVSKTAPIRALLLLLAIVSFTAMPYAVLMPVFADKVLHSGARGLGILMGASGVGALVGSVMLALRSTVRGLGTWVSVSCTIFAATLVAFGVSRSFWLSTAILIPLGASMMVQMSSSNTLIQSMVPDELRGRVMAAYTMMFMGMGPIGSLAAGTVADRFGAPIAVIIGGGITLAGAAVFAQRLPSLRGPARQMILAQQAAGGDPPQEATPTGAEVAGSD
jgi:MFS family permease